MLTWSQAVLKMPARLQTSYLILDKLLNLSEPPRQGWVPHSLGRTDSAVHWVEWQPLQGHLTRGCGDSGGIARQGPPPGGHRAWGGLRPQYMALHNWALTVACALFHTLPCPVNNPSSHPKGECGANCLFQSTVRIPWFGEGGKVATSGVGVRGWNGQLAWR